MSAEDSTIQQAELDRLIADFLERQDRGERVNEESMLREHPEHADGLRAFFGENARLHRVRSGFRDAESQSMEYRAGDQIGGRYKLLELIGEGGMGSVWLAQQLQPVKRKVAIKLIRAGMDSKVVLARFEAERQALALMEHPNIAQVFDGGVTERGRPYFVMEYIKGVPLTEYCDEARLSIRERMELMLPICRAVQHAHTRGIVHRDLKPSNIMVCLYDGHPVPKVIDFGLAKALHQNLTEQTLHTAHGAMVGTPIYMSPEQAELNNLDVDTRTDVYSLGVVLYELLTGTTPLDREFLQRAAMHEVLRLIREEEAVRPSIHSGEHAAQRQRAVAHDCCAAKDGSGGFAECAFGRS
jgi:serine/threonine protein kinase